MIEIVRGTYEEYKKEIDELILLHWKETGIPGADNLKLNLNEEVYKRLSETNGHLGLGLIENNKLIGYLSIFIYEHHQHVGEMFAQTDGFFTDPSKRGFTTFKAIMNMFKKAETILKTEFNVKYMYLGCNAQNDLKFLADSLEYTPSSVMYLKRL